MKIPRAASELLIMGLTMGLGLPACIALFSQRGSIKADRVEKEFRDVKPQDGKKKPSVFYYNRGL